MLPADTFTALAAHNNMVEAGLKADTDTYTALLTAYTRNRDWQNVKDTFSDIFIPVGEC